MQKLALIFVDAIEMSQHAFVNINLNMEKSYLSKRISYILLFYFSTFASQKVSITNNTGEIIVINNNQKEIVINDHEKKELPDITEGISVKNNNRLDKFINVFLEPKEKLNIIITNDNNIIYNGDKANIHEYINEKLNIETFGKINIYLNAIKKKNLGELKRSSELILLNIMNNIKQESIISADTENNSVKKMKNYIKYNWLNTIFSAVNSTENKNFSQEAIDYYYKKYIKTDILKFSCNDYYHYKIIEILAKNKDVLRIELPTYTIIETTKDDNTNQYLSKSCQKFYFLNKFRYLDYINSSEKEFYQKILSEKFND
ncbi:hypothetical protein [Chryseobacterium cucumeris]|uniref:Uncharacterized protein n=2 Tax=Chryseobacterium TaxID=59732 RepID=A0ABX9X6J0_9FLAO|nr:hypothetical protein [Chryseobacterium cucumeris]KYH05722.1 hypothetical protein A1704_11560 [Chryseobacterium cucumeris]MDH5032293.1 hypothetical protein [Chryseobacterium cucumeris]ROH90553.1 hypothetical protein EGI15_18005 [Chryseobacterium cucumeris]